MKKRFKFWSKLVCTSIIATLGLTQIATAYTDDKLYNDILQCKNIEKYVNSLALDEIEGIPILRVYLL